VYIRHTAIMTEEPYYTIAVDVNGTRYEAEFFRTIRGDAACFWKPEASVVLRLDSIHVPEREDGSEAKFLMLKAISVGTGNSSSLAMARPLPTSQRISSTGELSWLAFIRRVLKKASTRTTRC